MPLQAGDIDPLQRLGCRHSYESYNPASDRMDALLPTTLSRGQYGTKILCCTAKISLQRMTSALDQRVFLVNSSQSVPENVSMSGSPHFLAVWTKGRMQISNSKPKPAIFSSYTHTLHPSSLLVFFSSCPLSAANVAPRTPLPPSPALQLRSRFRPTPTTGTRSE